MFFLSSSSSFLHLVCLMLSLISAVFLSCFSSLSAQCHSYSSCLPPLFHPLSSPSFCVPKYPILSAFASIFFFLFYLFSFSCCLLSFICIRSSFSNFFFLLFFILRLLHLFFFVVFLLFLLPFYLLPSPCPLVIFILRLLILLPYFLPRIPSLSYLTYLSPTSTP